ncbi:MAG: fimbrial protein [Rhizobiaceae bacterium]|jgi:hypothetical protein|nr:fimbrial protein [Rhizobiaceae bacterium]
MADLNPSGTDGAEDDKPLDPAIEAVRRKLARLLIVSIGIMLAGVLAVLGAVVYKIRDGGGTRAEGSFVIPVGATVVDQSLGTDAMALRVRLADGTEEILTFSTRDGSQTARWRITPMP